jgi:hypothetical protein
VRLVLTRRLALPGLKFRLSFAQSAKAYVQLVSSKCDPREGEGGSRGRVKAYFMYLAT